jgi:hypothetical protein
MKEINCKICKRIILGAGKNQQFCLECYKERRKNKKRGNHIKFKERNPDYYRDYENRPERKAKKKEYEKTPQRRAYKKTLLRGMGNTNCEICKKFTIKTGRFQKYCKECLKLKRKEDNKEYMKAFRRDYPEKMKGYYNNFYNSDRGREYRKKYPKSEKGKINIRKGRQKYHKLHSEKDKARVLAIYKIKIPQGELCEMCNKALAIHRHHEDYSKPLEVKLLCRKCHNEMHKKAKVI